ncbi:hypothetical protein ACOJM8_000962 [Klebsiella aerogenes]
MTTDITELAQSLKAAADSVIKNYDIEWFEAGHQICTVHKSKINLISLANPANILALVEALEKAQQKIQAHERAELTWMNALSLPDDASRDDILPGIQGAKRRITELEDKLSRYSMSAGEADQRRSESRAVRDALGFREDANNVAPIDLRTCINDLEKYRTAYMEWSDKTDWMQRDKRFDVVRPLGKHRADVLKEYIEHLESRTVTVKLPTELYTIGELIRTQDNRITDQPMFVIFQKREIIGSDEHSPSRICWVRDGEEVNPLRALRLEILYQDGRDTSNYDRYAMQEVDEFVTACFTEHGCKEYLRQNGHNLRLPYIYACGSFRNNEYQLVRNWLAGIKVEVE